MARKPTDRYVRFYTFGSAAVKLEQRERGAKLPEDRPRRKRVPLEIDPFALVGNAVAILLAILMIVGLLQVHAVNTEIRLMQGKIAVLERQEAALREEYESGYDLSEIRVAAQSMGMIPLEQALRVSVQVPTQMDPSVQLGWWDQFLMSLRQFFA